MVGITIEDNAPDNPALPPGCHVVNLISWHTAWCYKTDKCPAGFCGEESYNWRDRCGQPGQEKCDQRKKTFDVAVAFMALSFICTSLLLLGFVIRCCGCGGKDRSVLHAVIGCLGLLCLIISVTYFAVRLPKAITEDQGGVCDEGPCKSFAGSTDLTAPTPGKGKALNVWSPAGWICGIIAIPFYLYVICCAFSHSIDRDAPLLGKQQYQQEGQNPYQPLTTAGSTYVPPTVPNQPHQV
jgi:hypothetical protein